jgi:hypothetical protein
MRRLGVVAEIAGHGGADGEYERGVRLGGADEHVVEHSPAGGQFLSETIAARAEAGSIWLPEWLPRPVLFVRINSLSWSPVTESNRRPSPYRGRIGSVSLVPQRFSARLLLTVPKSRSITSAPSCRTGRSSCRYTVSVTWLLAWPASRAIFSIAMPSSDRPGPLANVLEHLPDVPGTPRCTGGRGEYPAGVLPMRSGSLPLSGLVHLPLPERPDGHLRQLQRAAGPRGLRVSSDPIRAQMHRWFPAVVTGLRLAFQKGHLAAKTWWAQLGSNQ